MKGQITRSRPSRERKEHDYINLSKQRAVVVVVVTFLVIGMGELPGIVVAPVVCMVITVMMKYTDALAPRWILLCVVAIRAWHQYPRYGKI